MMFGIIIYDVVTPEKKVGGLWPRYGVCFAMAGGATVATFIGYLLRRGPIEGFLTLTTACLPLLGFFSTERRWVMVGIALGIYILIALAVSLVYLNLWVRSARMSYISLLFYVALLVTFIVLMVHFGKVLIKDDKNAVNAVKGKKG